MIYTVEKGKHDFKPNNQAWITAKNKIEGSFRFTESMYFTQEDPDYQYGVDAKDWNKIAGLTWFLSSNSNCSGILAWRPNEKEKNSFEIAGYVNPRSGGFKAQKIINVFTGEVVQFQLIWTGGLMTFKTKTEQAEDWTFTQIALNNPPWWFRFYREIGPWFGGNRTAHKEMRLELELR